MVPVVPDSATDEATWWHTYALPELELTLRLAATTRN
jgi:hypothetical protein